MGRLIAMLLCLLATSANGHEEDDERLLRSLSAAQVRLRLALGSLAPK